MSFIDLTKDTIHNIKFPILLIKSKRTSNGAIGKIIFIKDIINPNTIGPTIFSIYTSFLFEFVLKNAMIDGKMDIPMTATIKISFKNDEPTDDVPTDTLITLIPPDKTNFHNNYNSF